MNSLTYSAASNASAQCRSKKASGTPHPAVLSMYVVESDFKPGLQNVGEHDWILYVKIGETPIGLIVVGKVEG
jgi:hypothetical protein